MGELIWGNLLHLSFNMWEDRPEPEREMCYYRPYLRFDEALWREILNRMAEANMNMVVIDLGDAVRYESHPEISLKDAWTVDKLKEELARIREMGMEPIPKLNFSTCHDAWLGEYARCVSTHRYYSVCRDLIAEVMDIFNTPRLFHLGMDEETFGHQQWHSISIVRQFDLWWHDLELLCDEVRKGGGRPWVWSDYVWHHQEAFAERMPKNVLQSNWYYGARFDQEDPDRRIHVGAYRLLEDHGYDQVPTASSHSNPNNFHMTVQYCRRVISAARLLGFLQTPWRPTLREFRGRHLEAVEQVGKARREFLSG